MSDRIAASLSPTDVQAAMDAAVAGDRVVLPAGTASWTSGIIWTAPADVTLIGAGTTATGGGDQTVITDDIASGARLIKITVASTGTFRFSGITVQSGTGSTKDNGTIQLIGPGSVRIDHCHFNASSAANYKIIQFNGGVFGVLDHCILDLTGTNALYFYNGRLGSGDTNGNYEWTQPTNFGGSDYFYIEDNIINGDVGSGAYSTRIWDGFTASKVVVRFNTVSQAVLSETHDTGHAPDDRGTRSQEIYGNAVTSSLAHDPNFCAVSISGGTGLVWGNSWNQVYKNIYVFKEVRAKSQANGGTYNQTATPGGWGYMGTEENGTGSNWDGGTYNGTATLSGYPGIDQVGRGSGDLLTGTFPNKVNSATGTIAWPNQPLEPVYIWNNTGTLVSGWGGATVAVTIGSTNNRIVSDRDYYLPASGIQTSPTSPFNGTTGVGWGTLANRPTTCTAGVAYFATDQGSWNTSASNPHGVQMNGASGVLYKATATNTWTAYYTPYSYPHPLASAPVSATPRQTAGTRQPRASAAAFRH